MEKFYLKWGLFSSVLTLFLWLNFSAQAALSIGSRVPEFKIETSKGYTVSYQKHFKNKVTFVVLSNYCSVELAGVWGIPFYYQFRQHPDFRFAFIFSKTCLPAYIPRAFITSSLQNAQKSLHLPYILIDWDNQVSQKLGAHAKYAQLYLLDQQGKVIWQHLLTDPFSPPEPAQKIISKLLK